MLFFKSSVKNLQGVKENRDSFLGYVDIFSSHHDRVKSPFSYDDLSYIHGAIISCPPIDTYFIKSKRLCDVSVDGGITLTVEGSFFNQQNQIFDGCVHTSIKNAIWNLLGQKVHADQLEKLGKFNKDNSTISVTFPEVREFLKQFNITLFAFDFEKKEGIDDATFQQLVYYAVESGFPVILGIRLLADAGHVVTVVGHTFNKDTWLPEAERDYFKIKSVKQIEYIPSVAWVNNFIVQDDNYGPYYCLPIKSLQNNISFVAALTDFHGNLYGNRAEYLAAAVLYNTLEKLTNNLRAQGQSTGGYWFDVLIRHWETKKLIFRTLYTKKQKIP